MAATNSAVQCWGEDTRRLTLDVLPPEKCRDQLDHVLNDGVGKGIRSPAAANLNARPHRSGRDHVMALLSDDRLDASIVQG